MLPQTLSFPPSLSKIPSFWALFFLPLLFLLLLFSLQSSGRNLGHFLFVSLYLLSVTNIREMGWQRKHCISQVGEIKFLNSVLIAQFPLQFIFKSTLKSWGEIKMVIGDYTYKHSRLNGNIFPVFKIELGSIFLIDSTWTLNY